ncbi:MAG: gliding motility-associated-like protein [Limisphaerales bacterium]|jgi:gliding motility-associated-like protein
MVSEPGTVVFEIKDGPCSLIDSVKKISAPNPEPDWPDRPIVCPDLRSSFFLSPGFNFNLVWDNGSTANPFLINAPGIYSVNLISNFGCEARSEIEVEEDCGIILIEPNAFTPNGDGTNDYFALIGNNLISYDLQVFSRWGDVVFRTTNIKEGWDGTYKGRTLETGTYIWRVVFTDIIIPEAEKVQQGAVHLIR